MSRIDLTVSDSAAQSAISVRNPPGRPARAGRVFICVTQTSRVRFATSGEALAALLRPLDNRGVKNFYESVKDARR